MYFLEYPLKNGLFIVNSMQNQVWSNNWHSAIDQSIAHRSIAMDVLATPGIGELFEDLH